MARTFWIIAVCRLNKFEKNNNYLFFSLSFSLGDVFMDIDGKLLCQLHKMKQLAADAYYKFLDKHFDRQEAAHMSDILKFDDELERLFQ